MRRTFAALSVLLLAGLLANGCMSLSSGSTGFVQLESQQLYSIRYDAEAKVLTVVQRNGEVFDYREVPAEVYQGLLEAPEKDAYFDQEVKAKFKPTKLTFEE